MTISKPLSLTVAPGSVFQHWAVAIFALLTTVLGTFAVTFGGIWTLAVGLQLAVLVATNITQLFVPLAGWWAPFWKFLAAVIGGAAAAAIPLATPGHIWSSNDVIVVVFAGVNAVAVLLGVGFRTTVSATSAPVPQARLVAPSLPAVPASTLPSSGIVTYTGGTSGTADSNQ